MVAECDSGFMVTAILAERNSRALVVAIRGVKSQSETVEVGDTVAVIPVCRRVEKRAPGRLGAKHCDDARAMIKLREYYPDD